MEIVLTGNHPDDGTSDRRPHGITVRGSLADPARRRNTARCGSLKSTGRNWYTSYREKA